MSRRSLFLSLSAICFVAFSVLFLCPSLASALEIGNPINSDWLSAQLLYSDGSLTQCYAWQNTGMACGNNNKLVRSLAANITGYVANNLYLVSFTFVVNATNTESFAGLSSGQNFVIVDQTLTQDGTQFHGSVLAITRATNGVASFNSDTRYNHANAFSLLMTRPSSVPLFNSEGGSDMSGIQEYLQTISWNSTETQKKLETIISALSTANGHLSIIEWNSTETQKKLESIIAALGASNSNNSQTNGLLKDQLEEDKKQTSIMEETKDFITDDSTPEASDIANADSLPSVGLLPSGPLDSLLLLPLNVMNSILSSLGDNCDPVVAPVPWSGGQNITFPCFSDTIYTGDFALVGTLVGGVGSALILFYYFKHLYKKVDRATSLETTDDDEWGIL